MKAMKHSQAHRKCVYRRYTQGILLRDMSGQALIEVALLLPLFLLMIIGVIEVGRAAYASIIVEDAAHAGALYGAQSPATASDVAAIVQAALNDGQNLSGLSATATHLCTCSTGPSAPDCTASDCPSGRVIEYVQVNTTDQFTPLFHFPGIPSSFNLTGQALVRVEE